MTWGKVSDKLHSSPGGLTCSLAAIGLWTLVRSWCSDHETDGRVPVGVVDHLVGRRGVSPDLVSELVQVGWWKRDGDRLVDVRFLEENPSASELKKRRKHWKDKKNRQRAVPGGHSGASLLPDPDPIPSPNLPSEGSPLSPLAGQSAAPEDEELPESPKLTPSMARYTAAYDAGCSRAGAGPGGRFWDRGATQALGALLKAHSGALRGEALLAWIGETAAAYVGAYPPASRDAAYQGGYHPRKCAEWIQAGRPSAVVVPLYGPRRPPQFVQECTDEMVAKWQKRSDEYWAEQDRQAAG